MSEENDKLVRSITTLKCEVYQKPIVKLDTLKKIDAAHYKAFPKREGHL